MEAQPMDHAFDLALGASAAMRELLASVSAPAGDRADRGGLETPRRAQIRRKGEALVAALVAYARSQALSPQAIEVLPFVNSFASLLWHTLDRRISISVDVERDCPALFVDPEALEEALTQIAEGGFPVLRNGTRGRRWLCCTVRRSDGHHQWPGPGNDHSYAPAEIGGGSPLTR